MLLISLLISCNQIIDFDEEERVIENVQVTEYEDNGIIQDNERYKRQLRRSHKSKLSSYLF